MYRPPRFFALAALLAGLLSTVPALADDADTPDPEREQPYQSALTAQLMYQILWAEISANNSDWANAYSLTLDAARKSSDARLYERAVEMGLRGRSAEYALQAARAWAQAAPQSKEANRYVLQIILGSNRSDDVVELLQRELAGRSGKDRVGAINQIPRYFAPFSDKATATALVQKALAADFSQPVYGPAAWAALGSLRLAAGDKDGALAAAQRGAAFNAQAEEPAVLALNLLEAGVPAAEDLVRGYLGDNALPQWWLAYVRILIGAQRYAQALEQSQTLNQRHPDYADAWLLRGSLELQEGHTAAAQTALRTYLGLLPPEQAPAEDSETSRGAVQAYVLLAQIAEQNGELDAAQAYLERIKNPQDVLRVQARRAQLLARQGKIDAARALIQNTPEQRPGDARTKLATEIQLLRDFKHFDTAYALLTQALRTYPADIGFAYELAMVAEKRGNLDEMEAVLRKLIATAPDYHHAYNALGYSLADRNLRLPEARALIQKALSLAPNDPFILDSLAWVEYRSGNLDAALQLLQPIFSKHKDAEIAAHLGEVLWVSGQREAALQVWREGLQQQQDNTSLRETIQRFQPGL